MRCLLTIYLFALGCSIAWGTTVSFSAPNIACADSTVTLNNPNTANGWSWQWTIVKGTDTVTNYLASPNVTFTATGTYKIVLQGDSANYTGYDSSNIIITACRNTWPGDANMDGMVTIEDVFMIGNNWGKTGPARPNASSVWIEQPCTEWNDWFTGINSKHADTDGNGTVNLDDTLAIEANFSETVPKAELLQHNAPLFLNPKNDFVFVGTVARYDIELGILHNQADNVYALSFYLDLDPTIFDTTVANIDVTDSWLGVAGVDVFSFRKLVGSRLYIAIVSTTGNDLNGYGKVAELQLQTLPQLEAGTTQGYYLTIPSGIVGSTSNGSSHTYSSQISEIYIVDSLTSIGTVASNIDMVVYPNPANERLSINTNFNSTWEISITNLAGQVIYQANVATPTHTIGLLAFAKGMYILQAKGAKEVLSRKILVE